MHTFSRVYFLMSAQSKRHTHTPAGFCAVIPVGARRLYLLDIFFAALDVSSVNPNCCFGEVENRVFRMFGVY